MYLFFDTETTGLPEDYQAPLDDFLNWPRLVQIAWSWYDETGEPWESCSFIIKPEGFVIPSEVVKIHRISQARALKEGVFLRPTLERFLNAVNEANYLVAHNIDFDLKVIGAELLREKLANPLASRKQLCTMRAGADVCQLDNGRGGYKWPSLTELHRCLFAANFSEAHDAVFDVKACAACFFALKNKGAFKAF